MPGLYRDQGVVLRTIKLGEADRIVTFLTQGHGKVRAVAKGVRKSGSRFGARLEPTSHVAIQCYRGRELDVVTQVETIDANRRASGELRLHHPCGPDARGGRPGRAGAGADAGDVPDARRRAADAERAPVAGRDARVLLEAVSLEGFHPISTGACAAVTSSARSPRSSSPRAGCSASRAAGSAGSGSSPRRWSSSAGSWAASCTSRSRSRRAPPRARDRAARRPCAGAPLRAPPAFCVSALSPARVPLRLGTDVISVRSDITGTPRRRTRSAETHPPRPSLGRTPSQPWAGVRPPSPSVRR